MKEILFLILFLNSNNSFAKDYRWQVLSVVDGDTIKVAIPNLPEELKVSVRVLGIDTPEKGAKAKCPEEAELGEAATLLTKQLVKKGKSIVFSNIKWDKYGGRILADVSIDGVSLTDSLVKAKVARKYFGDKKQSWCK